MHTVFGCNGAPGWRHNFKTFYFKWVLKDHQHDNDDGGDAGAAGDHHFSH